MRSKLQPHAAPFEVETLTTRSLFEIQTLIASGRVAVKATATCNRFSLIAGSQLRVVVVQKESLH